MAEKERSDHVPVISGLPLPGAPLGKEEEGDEPFSMVLALRVLEGLPYIYTKDKLASMSRFGCHHVVIVSTLQLVLEWDSLSIHGRLY